MTMRSIIGASGLAVAAALAASPADAALSISGDAPFTLPDSTGGAEPYDPGTGSVSDPCRAGSTSVQKNAVVSGIPSSGTFQLLYIGKEAGF